MGSTPSLTPGTQSPRPWPSALLCPHSQGPCWLRCQTLPACLTATPFPGSSPAGCGRTPDSPMCPLLSLGGWAPCSTPHSLHLLYVSQGELALQLCLPSAPAPPTAAPGTRSIPPCRVGQDLLSVFPRSLLPTQVPLQAPASNPLTAVTSSAKRC